MRNQERRPDNSSPPGPPPFSSSAAAQTRIVYLRLDPILQRLLKAVTDLQRLVAASEDETSNWSAADEELERREFLNLVKAQVRDLEDLSRHLTSFGNEFAPSLILLADYVTLPLTAIFHIPVLQSRLLLDAADTNLPTDNGSSGSIDPKEKSRRRQILWTYVRKLYSSAATAIQVYVATTWSTTTTLKGQYLTKYLIALTSSLPSSSEVEMASKGDEPAVMSSSRTLLAATAASAAGSGGGSSPTLDDGSEAWVTILRAIVATLRCCSERTLLEAWQGTLLMRMADCVAGIVEGTPSVFTPLVCSHALQTLQELLRRAPTAVAFWQSVFPGIFTALYKGILGASRRTNSSGASLLTSIEASSLGNMSELLRVSLVSLNEQEQIRSNAANVVSKDNILLKLAVLAKAQSQSKQEPVSPEPSNNFANSEKERPANEGFLNQVQTRVVGPLSVILRQEAISRSDQTRKEVVTLCRVLLLDTRYCWRAPRTASLAMDDNGRSSRSKMEILPFEICMTLERDPEEAIASYASSTIKAYLEQTSSLSSSWMTSRIIESAEKIPVLLQGGKKVEIRVELQLLTGYLRWVQGLKGIGGALTASTGLKEAFVKMADLDFESSPSRRLVSPRGGDQSGPNIIFRRLDLDLSSLVSEMLEAFGTALGAKHGALFVDGVLCDLSEASLNIPSHQDSFVEWMHEWIGSLAVAKFILHGAFTIDAKESRKDSSKSQARHHRILESLASSILPLLVDSTLWNLPINARGTYFDGKSEMSTVKPLAPIVLQVNAAVVVLLLDLIGEFSCLLGSGMEPSLSSVLYPVVARASQNSVEAVKAAAVRTLQTMGLVWGFETVQDLINEEQTRLVAEMVSRLRLPGGTEVPSQGDAEEILSVATSLRWTLTVSSQTEKRVDQSGRSIARRSGLVDLMSLLEYRLDHLFLRKSLGDDDVEDICMLHKAFFDYFLFSFAVNDEAVYSYKMKGLEREPEQPWLDTLSMFRRATPQALGTTTIHELQKNAGDRTAKQLLNITAPDIALFSKLLARNGYLLSYRKLKSRITSCEGLTSGFKFLAFVGSEHQDEQDEQNYIQNSILRQVADLWPSVKARLKTLSEEMLEFRNRTAASLVVVPSLVPGVPNGQANPDVHTQRIFLAKLFALIGTMCECAGDFMADRFRNDVWSVMARHLGNALHQQVKESSSGAPRGSKILLRGREPSLVEPNEGEVIRQDQLSTESIASVFSWSISERHLIMSILQCLNTAFRHEDCGRALGTILLPAGTVLLPLLDIEDDFEIAGSAMDALKNILKLDCDVLWRPILELSGVGIRPCPLKKAPDRISTTAKAENNMSLSQREVLKPGRSLLATRCLELMAFVETLPEQALL